MKIELKRDTLIITPENDQDKAFIEDTLGLIDNGKEMKLQRVDDILSGFAKAESFVLKTIK